MNTQADLLLSAVGALQDFSNAAIAMGRALAPIISDVGKGFRDLGNAVYWQTGYDAGKNGDERQWTRFVLPWISSGNERFLACRLVSYGTEGYWFESSRVY